MLAIRGYKFHKIVNIIFLLVLENFHVCCNNIKINTF